MIRAMVICMRADLDRPATTWLTVVGRTLQLLAISFIFTPFKTRAALISVGVIAFPYFLFSIVITLNIFVYLIY